MKNIKKTILILLVAAIVVFGLIQLIPIDRTNPPVTKEPNWSTPAARALVKQSCFDCHSNETTWPWYSNIAPASWLVKIDVVRGRNKFNFSEWDTNAGELNEMVREINRGSMPPAQYTLIHTEARLDATQKQALIDALTASLK